MKENRAIFEINEASLVSYGYSETPAPTQDKFCITVSVTNFPLSSPVTATEKIISVILLMPPPVHQLMFPESLILNNQIPRLKSCSKHAPVHKECSLSNILFLFFSITFLHYVVLVILYNLYPKKVTFQYILIDKTIGKHLKL